MPETDVVVLGSRADGLEKQVRSFNASAVDGVDPVFHRGEKPWEIHYLPGHRTIGPLAEGPFVGYRGGQRGGPPVRVGVSGRGRDAGPGGDVRPCGG
jgi:hypothetical protein